MARQIKSGDSHVRCESAEVNIVAPGGLNVNGVPLVNGENPETPDLSGFASKEYVNEAVAAVADQQPTLTRIATGCQVFWVSDLIFRVSAGVYYIEGIRYENTEQNVTLNVADVTNPRFDVLVLDTAGTFDKVTGTPAADPSEPSYNPTTQLKLTIVLVAAGATVPEGVTNEDIYLENAQWVSSTSGTGFNANSTNNPQAGTKCIEGTNVANNAYVQLQKSTSITLDDYGVLAFHIRSKAAWANNRVLRLQFFLDGVAKGVPVTMATGYWGFDSRITGSYQFVAIPVTQFVLPAGQLVNQLRITDVGGAIGFYIDNIKLQSASTSVINNQINGLTQEQADARYVQLVNASFARRTVNQTTGSLANLAEQTGTITTMGKAAQVLIVESDVECRIRLYATSALRAADSARALGEAVVEGDPEPLLECNPVAGNLKLWVAPVPTVFNGDTVPVATVYYAIQNRSGSTDTVSVDFTILILEV